MKDRYNTKVVAIDPGLTCGWVLGINTKVMSHGESQPFSMLSHLDLMTSTGLVERVVYERYDARSFTNEGLETIEIIGVIKYLADRRGIPIGAVNAADKRKTKGFASAQTIREEGLGHAADAEAIRVWDLLYGEW